MNTDLIKVKQLSMEFFDLISIEDACNAVSEEFRGLFISHTYANSAIVCLSKNGNMVMGNIVENEEDYKAYRKQTFNLIDSADNCRHILMLINTPYKLLWFKYVRHFLSDRDYGELLKEIWQGSENPNQDVNVSLDEVIIWFKSAKKRFLMDKEELEYFKNLPSELTVYRGVSRGRNPKGLSYTVDKEQAIWFQNRFSTEDEPGFLIEKKIKKEDVLAYFTYENEIILNINQEGDRYE